MVHHYIKENNMACVYCERCERNIDMDYNMTYGVDDIPTLFVTADHMMVCENCLTDEELDILENQEG